MYDLRNRNNPLERALFDDWFAVDGNKSLQMRTDIKEDGDNYLLEVELPGIDKKDVDVSLENGYLTIKATVHNNFNDNEENKQSKKFIHRERFYGVSSRSYYVGDVDKKTINASLENGILTVSFPKESKEKLEEDRRIEIK